MGVVEKSLTDLSEEMSQGKDSGEVHTHTHAHTHTPPPPPLHSLS